MVPFPATFTCFAARRTFDQFFISANYAKQNVKLTGSDPGIAAAFNGGTHMSFEDIGLMRTIPNILICEPSDPVSLSNLLPKIAARLRQQLFTPAPKTYYPCIRHIGRV